mmetsp:Transcript_18339/g.37208  ORF Transcript_18339/g.37208 Transcript_18339/m.37208 type:complete len:211 (-) Transcript_18339:1269-1901(-)
MSWCGGGEISVTPGFDSRSVAMYLSIFCPGSWPPSPGLAPCASLISIWLALIRYSGETPKRPDATCLICDVGRSPFLSPRRYGKEAETPSSSTSLMRLKRLSSSPPSPELLLPPKRFMAMPSVSCASRDSAPSDMPPVQNLRMISSTGSTLSMEIGSRSDLMSMRSRSTVSGAALSDSWNSLYWSTFFSRSALCRVLVSGGELWWYSLPV